MAGRILGERSAERLLRVLIRWNNWLVKDRVKESQGLLLLVPICLQRSACEKKILDDSNNCQRCGECRIKDLIELKEGRGIDFQVVMGGRVAKEIVDRKRPEAVVAVACEKELANGIFETYPLPVFGIINERPKGPCKDTQVDMEIAYQAIGIVDESC